MTKILAPYIKLLNNGDILLYPTDTIWGIGCLAFNEIAVKKIFELKQRDKEKSFILLVSSLSMLLRYVPNVSSTAQQLIQTSSIPTTLIYNETIGLPKYLLAQDQTVAIRIIQHPYITPLIELLNQPLISTSANISGNNTVKNLKNVDPLIKAGVDSIMPEKMDVSKYRKSSKIGKILKDGNLFWIRE